MSNLISPGPSRRCHPCEHCSKSFNSSHQLAQHSRVHTGEKPYKCSYCDRKFKQLSHVQQHTRLHTGERPYKCAVSNCGRSFIQLSNLQQHMKTHSSIDKIVKESEKSFFCNHCGKGFKCESSLMSHETKKHSDQLSSIELFLSKDSRNLVQFNCHLCGKVLSSENAYKKHIQNHQCINVSSPASSASPPDIQLWTCDKCPSVFSNEFALLSHMDDMRSDPKHRFEPKIMLNCVNKEENTQNMNSLANSILENSDSSSHSNSSISANMLAQSIFQMNQNSIMEDSSPSQESNNRTD